MYGMGIGKQHMHMIPTRHPGLATTGIRFQAHDLPDPKIPGLVRFDR